MIAGYKLAAAVPEVTITATGFLVDFAMPRAKKPKPRSSKCVWQRPRLAFCKRTVSNVSGVEREPGAIQKWVTP